MKNILLTLLTITLLSFTFTDGWIIPVKYYKMKNPYIGQTELVPLGKMLYSKHCKSCHGAKGLGDGVKSRQLSSFPGDFSTTEFQSGSAGILYYQSFIGKDEMPNFEKKISDDEDRWAIINFIRTLKK